MNTFRTIIEDTYIWRISRQKRGHLAGGVPAGIPLAAQDFAADLARRGPGPKARRCAAKMIWDCSKSGVFQDETTGALLIEFDNKDTDSSLYDMIKGHPRPGHADFTAFHKFGGFNFNDYRGSGISGRITLS